MKKIYPDERRLKILEDLSAKINIPENIILSIAIEDFGARFLGSSKKFITIRKDEWEKRGRIIEKYRDMVERLIERAEGEEKRVKEIVEEIEVEKSEITKEIIDKVEGGLEKWEKKEMSQEEGLADFIVEMSEIPKKIGYSEEIEKAVDGILQRVSDLSAATLPLREKLNRVGKEQAKLAGKVGKSLKDLDLGIRGIK